MDPGADQHPESRGGPPRRPGGRPVGRAALRMRGSARAPQAGRPAPVGLGERATRDWRQAGDHRRRTRDSSTCDSWPAMAWNSSDGWTRRRSGACSARRGRSSILPTMRGGESSSSRQRRSAPRPSDSGSPESATPSSTASPGSWSTRSRNWSSSGYGCRGRRACGRGWELPPTEACDVVRVERRGPGVRGHRHRGGRSGPRGWTMSVIDADPPVLGPGARPTRTVDVGTCPDPLGAGGHWPDSECSSWLSCSCRPPD